MWGSSVLLNYFFFKQWHLVTNFGRVIYVIVRSNSRNLKVLPTAQVVLRTITKAFLASVVQLH